jgi:hypothetical protein
MWVYFFIKIGEASHGRIAGDWASNVSPANIRCSFGLFMLLIGIWYLMIFLVASMLHFDISYSDSTQALSQWLNTATFSEYTHTVGCKNTVQGSSIITDDRGYYYYLRLLIFLNQQDHF